MLLIIIIWAAPSEFGTYRLCEQRRFRRACASAQSRQNLRCSLIQAVSQEEPSGRKPDPWSLWMAGHAQLKFVMTECSKTQIRLAGLIFKYMVHLGWSNKLNLFLENLWCYQASVKWMEVSVYWKMWFFSIFNVIARVVRIYTHICALLHYKAMFEE